MAKKKAAPAASKPKKSSKSKGGSGIVSVLKAILVIVLCVLLIYMFSSRGGNFQNGNEPVVEKVEKGEKVEKVERVEKVEKVEKAEKEEKVEKSSKKLELPAYSQSARIVEHTGFVLAYNTKYNNPDWVAWELTKEEVNTKSQKRSDKFVPDTKLPAANRVETTHYKNSGYDRGHMCPAADMKWSAKAMDDCFYMSNICPQHPKLNQRWWEHTEEACRRWAKREGAVYICCGPMYNPNTEGEYIGDKKMRIRVPEGFFKVVLSLKKGEEKAIGFLYSNNDLRQTMEDAATTVDEVEEMTGYDFFPELEDALEKRVESKCDLRAWK